MSHKALVLSAPKGDWSFEDRPTPNPGRNQIVIQNRAIALNPADYKDYDTGGFIKKWPMVEGRDVAGFVTAVGPDVDKFKPGDAAIGCSIFGLENDLDQGTFQEYVLVYGHLASHTPDGILFESAASMPASIGTAAGLMRRVGMDIAQVAKKKAKDEAILIWGGSSSVGTSAVQFAATTGAIVFTTASPQHHEYLRHLGASAVFDYHSSSVVKDIAEEASGRGLTITKFVDAVSADLAVTAQVVSKLGGGNLVTVLPWDMMVKEPPPANVTPQMSGVRDTISDKAYSSYVFNELVPEQLRNGSLRTAKARLVPGGLHGVESGLDTLRKGVSGVKLVLSIK